MATSPTKVAPKRPRLARATLARALRSRSGQQTAPYRLREIIAVQLPHIEIMGDELPVEVDGLLARLGDGRLALVYNRALGLCDRRITIGHELGHALMDGLDARVGCRPGRPTATYREERADAFALELIIPRDELRRRMRDYRPVTGEHSVDIWQDRIDALSDHFLAPRWAILRQLRSCKFRGRSWSDAWQKSGRVDAASGDELGA